MKTLRIRIYCVNSVFNDIQIKYTAPRYMALGISSRDWIATQNCSIRSTRQYGENSSKDTSNPTTIDQSEVDHHAKFKETWWDTNGQMKGLHSMNKLRVPFVRDGILGLTQKENQSERSAKPLENVKILDVGCGGGILTEALSRLGADTTGIDAGSELIQLAKDHALQDCSISPQYICGTVENHAIEAKGTYDAIVASEVIEHVSNKEIFVEACTNLVKPGGSIFITTLNKTNISWLAGIVVAEYVLNLLPRGTHEWNKFISPTEVTRMLEKHNCRTVTVHGMGYQPLNNTWYWCSNKSINYALHAVRQQL